MKKFILFIFILLSPLIVFSKKDTLTNYGPNIGFISNTETFKEGLYSFGFSVRKTNKWVYIQTEVNLSLKVDNSEFEQMRIPVLLGARILKTFRLNAGAELRSGLEFVGVNKRGLNQLTYNTLPTDIVTPMIGIGLDTGLLCFDVRMTTLTKDYDKFQYLASISLLF